MIVKFKDIVNNINKNHNIPLILGKTNDNKILVEDLTNMPHLLVAGATGGGKSVSLHSIIAGIISSNRNIKLVLIDPKRVEFIYYHQIKQLLCPVIIDPNDVMNVLNNLIDEMDNRFKLMTKASVNHISKLKKQLPYIVVVIDEFADLTFTIGNDFLKAICKLASLARACGIHLIVSTQRPSADVVSGLVKANFPSRISHKVASAVNSRIILDCPDAKDLNGKGDAFIKTGEFDLIRYQGAFISVEEIKTICKNNQISFVSKFTKLFSKIICMSFKFLYLFLDKLLVFVCNFIYQLYRGFRWCFNKL